MLYILMLLGIVISSICGLMPVSVQLIIPFYFRFLAFMIGALMAFIGIVIVWIRARKTGAAHLIAPGRPGLINWFYIYGDGEVRITPGMRAGEGQLYNPDLDAQIPDVKTYSLCDHKIRFVPEVVGHAVDIDYVLYVNLMDSMYGFENIREARQGFVNTLLKRTKEIFPKENVLVNDDYEIKEDGTIGEINGSFKKKIGKISTYSKYKPTKSTA